MKKIEELKKELEHLLPVEKIEEWESMTTKEQDYCYALMSGAADVRIAISETIKNIEGFSRSKGVWLNEVNLNKKEIKAVRNGFIAVCKRAIDIIDEIMDEMQ